MRHHKKNRKLHRVKRQRVALLRSLARSLVLEEGITTSISKAKELRPYIERIITESKKNSISSRRLIAARLGASGSAVQKLHETLRERFAKRSGGYTRIVRLGRVGKREMESARIELVK